VASDLDERLEEMNREARDDPRSNQELIAVALSEQDEEIAWEAVTLLHRRGTHDILTAAQSLCQSPSASERELGANILGQLGVPTRSYPGESIRILLDLASNETDESVLEAVCIAFGHLHDPLAVPTLSRLRNHPNEEIRYSVAYGLTGLDDVGAIRVVIELTMDPADRVRDWATFALGSQIDSDTPEVREALFRRLNDSDGTVRGEALVGLARRRDARILERLVTEYDRFPIEAAEEFGATELLPTLCAAKRSAGDDRFDVAIRNCSTTNESPSPEEIVLTTR
jgi:HEAT repeat protein